MNTQFDKIGYPHRRYNPLIDEWVLVSPQRAKRPWQGKLEQIDMDLLPGYDPGCYLCPGNARANGKRNSRYSSTYVFTNDFSALLPDSPEEKVSLYPFIKYESIKGTCRVICFSPRHDLTMAEMSINEIQEVINVWADQISELGVSYRWIQIFENKGTIMGCSNPHPHGQVWAGTALPDIPFKENISQLSYFQKNNSILLMDYLNFEFEVEERIVIENDDWIVFIPFWAVWPFETLVLPRRHVLRLPDLNDSERENLAEILKHLLTKYDNLFSTSFPYSMGWHGAPTDSANYSHWQLHAHFYPPLLRSNTIKKFIVGYEMLSEVQRDLNPEQAAKRIRELSDVHYKVQHE